MKGSLIVVICFSVAPTEALCAGERKSAKARFSHSAKVIRHNPPIADSIGKIVGNLEGRRFQGLATSRITELPYTSDATVSITAPPNISSTMPFHPNPLLGGLINNIQNKHQRDIKFCQQEVSTSDRFRFFCVRNLNNRSVSRRSRCPRHLSLSALANRL